MKNKLAINCLKSP